MPMFRIGVDGIAALYEASRARDTVHPNALLERTAWATGDCDGNLLTFFEDRS